MFLADAVCSEPRLSDIAGGDQGFHEPGVVCYLPLSADPRTAHPQSSVYSKTVSGLAQLFFQNGPLTPDNVYQLTGLPIDVAGGSRYGFKTPWGLTFNMGSSSFSPVTFATPFSGVVYTALLTDNIAFLDTAFITSVDGTSLVYSPFNQPVYYFVVGAT